MPRPIKRVKTFFKDHPDLTASLIFAAGTAVGIALTTKIQESNKTVFLPGPEDDEKVYVRQVRPNGANRACMRSFRFDKPVDTDPDSQD